MLKPGVEGGYRLNCINPNCGASVESETLRCPHGWVETEEGYLCPRERVRLIWEPLTAAEVYEQARAENEKKEQQILAKQARIAHEVHMRATLERKRQERERRLAEQQKRESDNAVLKGKRLIEREMIAHCAARVRSLITGVVTKRAVQEVIDKQYPELTASVRDAVLRAAMSGAHG